MEANADANSQDPLSRMTPLHLILMKYHLQRKNDTIQVELPESQVILPLQAVSSLMSAGADPCLVNAAGESPAHIVVQTQVHQDSMCPNFFLRISR